MFFFSDFYAEVSCSVSPESWSSGWSHGGWGPLLRWSPPRPALPSLCRAGALPSPLSNHSSQAGEAATHRKELYINSERRREERRGERKRPGNLVDREIGKEWQNPDRLQRCDWKRHFSWVGEKGRGEFSRMLKLLWDFSAQRLRTGKRISTPFFFFKWRANSWILHYGVSQLFCFKCMCGW